MHPTCPQQTLGVPIADVGRLGASPRLVCLQEFCRLLNPQADEQVLDVGCGLCGEEHLLVFDFQSLLPFLASISQGDTHCMARSNGCYAVVALPFDPTCARRFYPPTAGGGRWALAAVFGP